MFNIVQNSASAATQSTKHKMLNDLDIYESNVRDKAIKFCGWYRNKLVRTD